MGRESDYRHSCVCRLLVLRLVPLVLPVRLPVQQVRDQVWNTASKYKERERWLAELEIWVAKLERWVAKLEICLARLERWVAMLERSMATTES
jgi:hypothetical protein